MKFEVGVGVMGLIGLWRLLLFQALQGYEFGDAKQQKSGGDATFSAEDCIIKKAMSVSGERELVVRAQRGDVAAFGELVRRHQSAVYNVAYRMTGSRHDAEDLAQEAFLRAFKAFDRFDTDRPIRPWLKRIATNLCLNWLQSSRVKTTNVVTDMQVPGQEAVTMDSYAQTRPLPEQAVIRRESAEQIRAAILQLPPQYRAVIELRHFQELSYDEMAETLGRSVSNVKSDLYRARRMLAEVLGRE